MKFEKRSHVKPSLIAFAMLVFFAASCSAQRLDFSIDGGNSFGNDFDVGIGSTTDVGVYLSEIPPDTTLSTEGLFSFGLLGDLDMAAPGEITAASIDAQFDFVDSENFNTIAIEWEAAVVANAIPTGPRILLGEIQFVSTGGGDAGFIFGDLQTGSANANWLTENGTVLDESIFGSGATDEYSLTLTSIPAVPEPFAFPLIVIGMMTLGACRTRANATHGMS